MKPRILTAALLVIAGFNAEASARTVCIVSPDGQKRCYQVADEPTAAAPAPRPAFPVLAAVNPMRRYIPAPEHSVVTHREVAHAGPFVKGQPMRNVLRGAARIVAAPFRLAKQVLQNGVERRQARRAARRCSR